MLDISFICPCSLSKLHSTDLLASPSLSPPAIMCSRGVSNGPWLSFPQPLPFHFLITSPLPSSLEFRQDYPSVIPPSAPSHTSWWRSGMTLRWQEMGICDGHLSLLPSLLLHASLAHYVSRSSLRAHTLGTGHRSFQEPWVWWGNYFPFWSPPAPLPPLTAWLWVDPPLLSLFFAQWESSFC